MVFFLSEYWLYYNSTINPDNSHDKLKAHLNVRVNIKIDSKMKGIKRRIK